MMRIVPTATLMSSLTEIRRNARIKMVAMMVMAVKEYLTHTQLNIRNCDML
jgi:hypothetical protein